MLDTLIALCPPGLRAVLRAWVARPQAEPVLLPGLDARPAPMKPLLPPAATNDNPLLAVQEAVERDLRASGHLR
ncbi:hypothetical protein SAMN05216360_11668 [Methylobacterium phyllostachyos]|uniref:Uncharacterized protein n=1 Tax=Methylobacterium phyllostachyos TaxID=582672 RepID=A0A1H0HMF6_9HYPH|nr:hypothetical protein [Methylobacterium phyllostachyos]SDO20011.1 hypothetical protein SAMN05216360_11668 [Methylobacterium phyllostachyos]